MMADVVDLRPQIEDRNGNPDFEILNWAFI